VSGSTSESKGNLGQQSVLGLFSAFSHGFLRKISGDFSLSAAVMN
jgi:hypothetical protein